MFTDRSSAFLFLVAACLSPLHFTVAQEVLTSTEIRVESFNNRGQLVPTTQTIMDQTVIVTAVVQAVGSRRAPVGRVTFRDGSRVIARGVIRSTTPGRRGIRTVGLRLGGAELRVGTHRLRASFRGSDGFRSSASRLQQHEVVQAQTSVTLTTDAMDFEGDLSEASFGEPVRITAKVELTQLDLATPRDGLVQFLADGRELARLPVGEPLVIDSLAAQQHRLSANYLGSRNYHPSESESHPLSISFADNLTVGPFVSGSNPQDRSITPAINAGLIFRRPSAAPTVNRFGSRTAVAVAYERQAIAKGPVDIELQVWDFSRSLETREKITTVSDAAVGVGFPDAAALLDGNPRDGRIVVVWQAPGDQGLDIFGRVFSRASSTDLFAVGPAFRVNNGDGGDQRLPRVSGTFDGGFVVVWQSPVIEVAGTVIFQRRFTNSGVPLGDETVVHPSLSGNQTSPEVAVLSTADYVVTWTDEGSRRIRGRQFLSNGIPRTAEFTLDLSTINFNDRGTRLAALPSSGYGITWSRPSTNSILTRTSVLRRFVGAVSPIGGLETVSLSQGADEFEPDLAPLNGGAFAAVWTGDDAFGSKGIGLRVYRPNGVATGLGEFANSQRLGDQFGATIAPVFSGQQGFVVVWTSELPEGGSNLALRLFVLPPGGL